MCVCVSESLAWRGTGSKNTWNDVVVVVVVVAEVEWLNLSMVDY